MNPQTTNPTAETWKDIPGYEGYYQVSDLGNVRSVDRTINKPLKKMPKAKGYLCVNLYKNTQMNQYLVHRLVLLAFVGSSPLICNHIDGDKTNNHLSNLEYVTYQENTNHAIAIGLMPAKLTATDATAIRELHSQGKTIKWLSKTFGIDMKHVRDIINRVWWKQAA